MKHIIILMTIVLFSAISCKKEESAKPIDNQSIGITVGSVTFCSIESVSCSVANGYPSKLLVNQNIGLAYNSTDAANGVYFNSGVANHNPCVFSDLEDGVYYYKSVSSNPCNSSSFVSKTKTSSFNISGGANITISF